MRLPIVVLVRRLRDLARDRSGPVAVEFALVAPMLFLVLVGMMTFGLVLHNYLKLTSAVESGALVFAISRGNATPLTSTVSQICSALPGLTPSKIQITISAPAAASCETSNTTCPAAGLDDATCAAALSGPPSAAGNPASITVTYPCALVVLGLDFAPSCLLSNTTIERIQ